MLKKLILLLLVVAPLSIFAQEKLAYINSQEVFMKMPELKDVETKLAAKSESINKQKEAIEAEYQAKLKEFQGSTDEPTQSVVLDRQKQIQQIQERFETFIESSRAEYEKEQQALITPLRQKMVQAIKTVGDENNYTYIFDSAALLHIGTHAIDASKQVKAKLGIVD